MKMEELFSNHPLIAYYKPELKFIQNGQVIEEIKYDLNLFKESASKSSVSLEEYNYILYWIQSMVSKNGNLFNDFHESSKKYIKRITNRK